MILPALRPDVAVADFDVELVVLVPSRRRAHLLEPLWALLLDSCRQGHTFERVAGEIVDATGWEAAATRNWLDQAISTLIESEVLTLA